MAGGLFFWRQNDGASPLVGSEAEVAAAESAEDGEEQPSWRTWLRLPQMQQEEENDVFSYCADLSYQTRLYGFLTCFALGTFMSISSSFFVAMIAVKPAKFAVPYTIGNVLSLGSSMFFVGPKRFFRTMFNEDRRIATAVYLASLTMTLVSALYLHTGLLTFVLIIVQFCAYLWLMASYIPYGRTMLAGTARSAMSMIV